MEGKDYYLGCNLEFFQLMFTRADEIIPDDEYKARLYCLGCKIPPRNIHHYEVKSNENQLRIYIYAIQSKPQSSS